MKFNIPKRTNQELNNYEGGKAFRLTPEWELYSAVVTASLSDMMYEKADDRLARIISLISISDPLFVAQLAIYTREKMHLRSVPLVLAVELAKIHSGDSLVKNTVYRIIQRADEITELLAYYQASNKRIGTKKLNKLSKQLQKGVAEAFGKFDEYQFAKYNREAQVKLRDALFIVHPKATNEQQQALFNKIVKDTLEIPYTWEVELSRLGQQKYATKENQHLAFKAKWEELILSGRLGYMALLRNLRNILELQVSSDAMKKVGEILSSETQVRNSKQLPFRFLSAYREVQKVNSSYVGFIMDCLEKAVFISAENIKGFDLNTRVLIASDVSGSMYSAISKNSSIQNYDIGLILSMLMRNRSTNVETGIFGDTWTLIHLPKAGVLGNSQKLRSMEGQVGYSTNGFLVIKDLIARKQKMDKILFFTDMQLWDSTNGTHSLSNEWNIYKKSIAPEAKLYLFDLAGHGQVAVSLKDRDVFLIAGWSDKVFDVLNAIENGSNALDEIKKIEV
ncbi:MAG: TROVE domain-containing protein [Cytophagaceae bacterium]|jgi:hypothetical protein|nr:TROVE domain-containing protein [Cytophagaceae bacterium]